MGAVSIIRYAETDPNICAIVLDSPFADFPLLCQQILNKKFFLPDMVCRFLLGVARDRIMDRIPEFDIKSTLNYI
jgi:hypothetical protein